MATILTGVLSLALILLVNDVCSSTQGSGDSNAQATAINSESDSNGEVSDNDIFTVMRYYVPELLGKTEPDNIENDFNNKPEVEIKDLSDDEINEEMKSLYQFINRSEHETDDVLSDDDQEIDRELDFEEENEMPEEENEEILKKRYQPRFVGKRHRTYFGGRQSNPMFIGKRYRPMFVGKRFASIAANKRYQPKFVGKRYTPHFVGKRYTLPFDGKRFESSTLEKAYMPAFVGKRDASSYTTKMYIPSFVGKRNPKIPRFVGKRFPPTIVRQRNNNNDFLSFIYGKQSNIGSVHDLKQAENTINARLKRSLIDETSDIKRAWGRYIPWENMHMYYPSIDKRFATPGFIGGRNSMSSILSALYALPFAKDDDRSATKRFQAPMFIGKRNLVEDILPDSTATGFPNSKLVLPPQRSTFLKPGGINKLYRDNDYFMYKNTFSGR